jgi:AraC-like DNA-binding protein
MLVTAAGGGTHDAARERRVEVRGGRGPWGSWESALAAPARSLRGAVVRYRGFRISTGRPRSRLEIPIGLPGVVFAFSGPLTLEDATGAGPGPQPLASFVVGLRTRSLRASHGGDVHGVEVMFSPAGAFSLLGCAMHEVANAVFPADVVLGRAAWTVEEQLAEADDWVGRFAVLDRFFAERARDGLAGSTSVHRAWSWLERERPRIAAARLADDLGWTQRRLESAFREQIGLAPATIVRMARFRRAVRLLARSESSLTELAVRCGYYDQSHFNREFRSVTGTSPQRYLEAAHGAGPGGDLGMPARISARRADRQAVR